MTSVYAGAGQIGGTELLRGGSVRRATAVLCRPRRRGGGRTVVLASCHRASGVRISPVASLRVLWRPRTAATGRRWAAGTGTGASPRHLQVKSAAGRRRYPALWRVADGRPLCLCPARRHVKDSGRRTPRGAIVWRAGDGPLPSPDHLTPADAAAALRELLAAAAKRAMPAGHQPSGAVTFGDACAEWLRSVEHERRQSPWTLGDYRSSVRGWRSLGFGADTPLGGREWLLVESESDGWHEQRRDVLGPEDRAVAAEVDVCAVCGVEVPGGA